MDKIRKAQHPYGGHHEYYDADGVTALPGKTIDLSTFPTGVYGISGNAALSHEKLTLFEAATIMGDILQPACLIIIAAIVIYREAK